MRPLDAARLAGAFARTRWGTRFRDRAALDAWQRRRIRPFLQTVVGGAAFYRDRMPADPAGDPSVDLAALPIVDKRTVLADFAAFNTRGIPLDVALAAAHAAERAQRCPAGFDPALAAGLSSGTQGPRSVFLAQPAERATWAGILLARTLDAGLLRDVLVRAAPLRVAFFLRANSALYTTLASRRIDFRFFDLHADIETHAIALSAFDPEVLVAPASVLAWLAQRRPMHLRPRRVISVAEVLEPDDRAAIVAAFGRPVHQLYQAMEGFLGYTCEHGTLHLNEEFVHVEPAWLDAARTRFSPIVTDFTRRTQMIVRYRLDDVLRVCETPCPCGRVSLALAAIEGRVDDVLWFASSAGRGPLPLFPDVLRHAFARRADRGDYRVEQHGDALHLWVAASDADVATITSTVDAVLRAQGMTPLPWRRIDRPPRDAAAKRRRIVCVRRPSVRDEARAHA